jgi:hypothetical protein
MHIPKYWARQKVVEGKFDATGLGWSDASTSEAAARAVERARKVLGILKTGRTPEEYEYGLRQPLREEIVEEKSGEGGRVVITRNRYGALVLNTESVMFIDIDDVPGPSRTGFLELIFGKKKDESLLRKEAQKQVIIETIQAAPNLRSVLYRTKAGFRVLVLSRLFDPASEETLALLQDFGADPLYVKLTRNQKCFRARLTPKPWRCGIGRPPSDHPRETPDAQREFALWLQDYNVGAGDCAVCESLGEYGSGPVDPVAANVRALHDSQTLSPGRALA